MRAQIGTICAFESRANATSAGFLCLVARGAAAPAGRPVGLYLDRVLKSRLASRRQRRGNGGAEESGALCGEE